MISKNKTKQIRSLQLKKNRDAEHLFVAEGPKVVADLLEAGPARCIVATKEWLSQHNRNLFTEYIEATEEELRKVSFLQHPQQVLAVFDQRSPAPQAGTPLPGPDDGELMLAVDGVQDPGNLGTIIRIADWFGIGRIVCSPDTADVYNPKVVQATMGSIARVAVFYTDLPRWLDHLPEGTPVYGTLLDGGNLYEQPLTTGGIIVMGNEGKGLSPEVRARVSHRLRIPNYPEGHKTADSLNVAVATAIVCAEFRRNGNKHL